MKRTFEDKYDENKPKEVVNKIAIILLYYGLLRRGKYLQIEVKDVKMNMKDNMGLKDNGTYAMVC